MIMELVKCSFGLVGYLTMLLIMLCRMIDGLQRGVGRKRSWHYRSTNPAFAVRGVREATVTDPVEFEPSTLHI